MDTTAIGIFICTKRKELNLTQEEFAEKVGVTRETVSKWERGKFKDMKEEKVEAIAKVLGVSILEIRTGKEMPELTEDDRVRLDEVMKDLASVEDSSLISAEIGFCAYGLSMSAFAMGWMANFPNNRFLPFVCYPLCIFGFAFMFFGRRVVKKIEVKLAKKRSGKNEQ